ncbi:DUF7344 domain-containing protein [Halorussus vallis]|uniref:DUF7344 domain-containing protein n=1 Tax=Halorussus vallis TaxID=2953749 RepID=UPI003F63D782
MCGGEWSADRVPASVSRSDSSHAEEAFDPFDDSDRRRTLVALRRVDGAASLDELAEHIVALAGGVDPGAVTTDRRDRAAAALHYSHLPALADAGVVEYDPSEGRVALADRYHDPAAPFDGTGAE